VSSPRPYPEKLPPLTYPETAMMRLVSSSGTIKWRDRQIFISVNIAGEYVGLLEEGDDVYSLNFGNLQLGIIDAETNTFRPEVRWADRT